MVKLIWIGQEGHKHGDSGGSGAHTSSDRGPNCFKIVKMRLEV